MKKKNKIKKEFGPVITIIFLIILIMFLSSIMSLFQVQGELTEIVNGSLETSVTTANNILSLDGIKYIFSNGLTNFSLFQPLVILTIILIGLGIGEASGLFKQLFSPFKKMKSKTLTLITLFIGIISTIIGDYSYMLLLPLIGIIYKYADKNAMLGIITVFLGITIGSVTGLIYSFDTLTLGNLTQLSATVDVDKGYIFKEFSSLYIMLGSTFILTIIGTIIIEKILKPKIKPSIKEDNEYIESSKAFKITSIVFIGLILVIIYMITPGLPYSGILLDMEKTRYIERLFSDTAPFKEGLILIITLVLMICGFVYGYISKNIKNSNDYSVGLSKSFQGLGYVFVLMFFISQMMGILDYTNLGEVITSKLTSFISILEISGIPLLILFILTVVLASILMPTTLDKWIIMSPLVIPLFMRSNITPEFTQFIFGVADGIGKSITPIFIYLIIMVAFLQKYNGDNEYKITIFGTIKTMLPTILLFIGLWLLIVIGWYIVNLPLGIGSFPTL